MKRPALPLWSVAVLALLFVPPAFAHEAVFGEGMGLIAAGAGIAVGLVIAVASTRWRWDTVTTAAVTVVSYLLLGGVAALRSTTLFGVIPSLRTLQLLVWGSYGSWKDLLTAAPPAASYTGLSVLPWLCGLVCGLAAGLLTLRAGRYVWGTLPIAIMGFIGIAWGLAGTRPPVLPVAIWAAAILAWWGWCAQRGRTLAGEEILIGSQAVGAVSTEAALPGTLTHTSGRVSVVYAGRRLAIALMTLALAVLVTIPAVGTYPGFLYRTVLRDLVRPPLDIQEYPSPLAAFRHYTTDLAKTQLVTVSSLPENARVRLAVMDTYDGITFGMSDPKMDAQGRYVHAGITLPKADPAPVGTEASLSFTTSGLLGPWLPSVGAPESWQFTGAGAVRLQDTLYVNTWAGAALTSAMPTDGTTQYDLTTVITPNWSDGQLGGVNTGTLSGTPDTGVPDQVGALAVSITQKEFTALGRARAIERYLSANGAFSNASTSNSQAGHRADRLVRMLEGKQLIGDDEQYASLMALMLHSLGMPARVVMGLYPAQHSATGPVELKGTDMHVWVEVDFAGVGWATFDPTPPRDQVPQTDAQRPRAVPRPQVLQPPDPPEPPVELPPAISQRDHPGTGPENQPFPWGVVAASSGLFLLLVGPIAFILGLKLLRSRRRRESPLPLNAVTGAWDNTVDAALDAGARLPRGLTRQETARLLAGTLWRTDAATTGASDATAPSIPLWYLSGDSVPTTIVLARLADTAAFAPGEPTAEDAASAWTNADALRASLATGVGLWTRMRRALSVRSLRYRAALSADKRWPPSWLPQRLSTVKAPTLKLPSLPWRKS